MTRILITLIAGLIVAVVMTIWPDSATMQTTSVKVDGCVKCHGQIEPMHKYGTAGVVLEKIKDGKDAVGLSCTACHGGNPASEVKEQAHVRPMFPREWLRNAQYTGANPERSNTDRKSTRLNSSH